MVTIKRSVLYGGTLLQTIKNLAQLKLGLGQAVKLDKTITAIGDLYDLGKRVFYIQITAWGGRIDPEAEGGYAFDDPALGAIFNAEFSGFLVYEEVLRISEVLIYTNEVSEEDKVIMQGIVKIMEV